MPPTLQRTTYKPNFNDPRVRKKVDAVLAWCGPIAISKMPRTVHHDELIKVFGNTGQPGLAQWLRANLLSQAGPYEPGKRSFSYRVKADGYEKLHRLINRTPARAEEIARATFAGIIEGREPPQYKDKGDRRYHPVQNIQREVRKQAFAGWWDYDIESCAPTLIHQYAMQFYRRVYHRDEGHRGEPFPVVARLVSEKAAIRKHFSELTGLGPQETKELVAAIFFRANMAPHPKARVFQLLRCNRVQHRKLVNDEFTKQLRADVRALWMWARLHDNYEKTSVLWAGKKPSPRPAKAAQHRQAIYRMLERKVIDAMIENFSGSRIPLVLMHDGFMAQSKLNAAALEKAVAVKTGFQVRLSEALLHEAAEIDEEPDVEALKTDPGEPDDEVGELPKSGPL